MCPVLKFIKIHYRINVSYFHAVFCADCVCKIQSGCSQFSGPISALEAAIWLTIAVCTRASFIEETFSVLVDRRAISFDAKAQHSPSNPAQARPLH
jgi:hypothetical protein